MYEKTEDFIKFYASLRKRFSAMGLYNLRNGTTLADGLKRFIIFFFTWLSLVSMVIKMVIGMKSLEEFTEILYFFTTQTGFISKLTNFVYGPGNLQKIEDHLRNPISQKYYNIFGREDLHSIMRQCKILSNLYLVLVTIILALFAMFPLLDASKEVPFIGYNFVDINVPINKCIVYAIQVFCIYISGYLNGFFDLFTAHLISIGVAKLRLIKTCFRNVDYSKNRELGSAVISHQTVCKKYLTPKDLGDLYVFHQYIVDYFAMIEELFSFGIFMQFLVSMTVVCMTGFQIMVTPANSSQFVFLVLYIVCMITQVGMYCWFGNEILFESDTLGESCYMSNWYEGTLSEKKFIFLVMERSKRQLGMSAGYFFTLSLPTLVMIMKSSYSYFAVIQRLYTED